MFMEKTLGFEINMCMEPPLSHAGSLALGNHLVFSQQLVFFSHP